jgi:CheY-like chemotaxis protein/two-component sensor histidine kinase
LRTPLSPTLLIASEAAENPQLPAEVRAQFAAIRTNVELEARLIDDLLDITRISHGKLSMDMGIVDIHAILQEAIATVRPELEGKRIELGKNLAAKPATVKGDAVRLQQVFWNVLKNAVKFTPAGGRITVSTRTRGTGELLITITDTGIGMSAQDLAQAFEAFTQGEQIRANPSHQFGGLGLGLAITKKLVELHHGAIQASSKGLNEGSVFVITLPLAVEKSVSKEVPASDETPPRASANGRGLPVHVLLVEDHEPTRTVLTHLLARRHYEVKTAASLAEARILSQIHEFDVLISDIGLPDGTGFELMSELHLQNKDLQGIALTGYGTEQDISKGRAAGFGVHLTKPIRAQSLDNALAEISSNAAKICCASSRRDG